MAENQIQAILIGEMTADIMVVVVVLDIGLSKRASRSSDRSVLNRGTGAH